MFNPAAIRHEMELLRHPNGAFSAAPTPNYRALWIRDTLYTSFCYWYLDDYEKLKQGIWIVFDLFKKHKKRIKKRVVSPIDVTGGLIHAKYDAQTLEEIVADDEWKHHQLDALGLFLHIVADLDFKHIRIIRDEEDLEILYLLIAYLRSVEYWIRPDFGMWEECKIRHSSSIGAVIAGLSYIRKQRLVPEVTDGLIRAGEEALAEILPFESRDKCASTHHRHDCDSAQLSLIWPYNVIVREDEIDDILYRISNSLKQVYGFNRYWGDEYYRSDQERFRGISAEWPLFKFWMSIICSQRHEHEKALLWFKEGSATIVDNKIPEAYKNGKPNPQTPLAWTHAIALIAYTKLPPESQKEVTIK